MRALILVSVLLLASCSSSEEDADAGAPEDASVMSDAGTPSDAGPPSGSLCQSGPCPETCFRPYVCVTECGGAETQCGCCPCAAGAIDTIDCP